MKRLWRYDTMSTGMQKYPIAFIVVDDVVVIRGKRYQDIKCEKKMAKMKISIERVTRGRPSNRRVIPKTMFSFLRLLY